MSSYWVNVYEIYHMINCICIFMLFCVDRRIFPYCLSTVQQLLILFVFAPMLYLRMAAISSYGHIKKKLHDASYSDVL